MNIYDFMIIWIYPKPTYDAIIGKLCVGGMGGGVTITVTCYLLNVCTNKFFNSYTYSYVKQ